MTTTTNNGWTRVNVAGYDAAASNGVTVRFERRCGVVAAWRLADGCWVYSGAFRAPARASVVRLAEIWDERVS